MPNKSLIIIGAGMAGLAAGCYGQANGYNTQVFEMHDKPGGLCTSWKRKGFTIDGCIHHLGGSGPASKIHRIWKELGALKDNGVLFFDELVRVEVPGGGALSVYTDLDRLEGHMKELAPEDGPWIDRYIRGARFFGRHDIMALPMYGAKEAFSMLASFPTIARWWRVTIGDYAKGFRSSLLRQAFPWVQYGIPEISMAMHLSFVAGCHMKTLGWPKGGSLEFSERIARRYLELGGQIHYRCRVEKILVEADKAVGVRLEDGSVHRADRVISTADGHTTIFRLLDGAYVTPAIRQYYQEIPSSQQMSVGISFGVDRDLSHEPHALTLVLGNPVSIGGKLARHLGMQIFSHDTGMAPHGKSVIRVLLDGSYDYWKQLHDEGEAYMQEKERVAEIVVSHLEERFPGIASQIEFRDVATPVTVERLTGNCRGYQPWSPPKNALGVMIKGLSRTLPGLKDFYMAGHWAEAVVGISTAAISGRNTIKLLCRRDGKRFAKAILV